MKRIHISEAIAQFVRSSSSLIEPTGLALWNILFLWVTVQLDPDISRQHSSHICTGQDNKKNGRSDGRLSGGIKRACQSESSERDSMDSSLTGMGQRQMYP